MIWSLLALAVLAVIAPVVRARAVWALFRMLRKRKGWR